MTLAFHHVCFIVSDLDRSLSFYRDILGLKLKDGPREVGEGTDFPTTVVGYPGARLNVAHLELYRDSVLELIMYIFPEGKKTMEIQRCDVGSAHIAFFVDDLPKYYDELRGKGVNFLKAPSRDSHGYLSVYFFDPDGFILELNETRRPR